MNDLDPRWGTSSFAHEPGLLAGFKPRPTDVLITTAPKAGTTWMQQILHQLRSGGDASFESIFEVVPWLEFPKPGKSIEQQLSDYEAIPNPRVFKTHCTFPQTPGSTVVRIVLSSRDPRDCCVSMYHHLMDSTDEVMAQAGVPARPASFEEFFDRWMEFGAWFRNVQSWWPHHGDANVCWVQYSEMKRDLPGVIERLRAFLGWSLTEAQRAAVLEHSSFAWMKTNAARFTRMEAGGPSAFKPGGFIRKGAIGDHKTLLTPQQEARIMDEARRQLAPDCLKFLDL